MTPTRGHPLCFPASYYQANTIRAMADIHDPNVLTHFIFKTTQWDDFIFSFIEDKMRLLEVKDHAQALPLISITELRTVHSTLASGPTFSMDALHIPYIVCGGPNLRRPTEHLSAPLELFSPCMPRLPTHLWHLYIIKMSFPVLTLLGISNMPCRPLSLILDRFPHPRFSLQP